MTKSVPTTITLPRLGLMGAGRKVISDTWREIVAAQHVIYGWQGAHAINLVFDPEWESLDFGAGGSVYHSVGRTSAAGYRGVLDLNQHSGLFRFQRRKYNTGGNLHGYQISMNVHAQNLNVRATLTRFDTVDGDTTSTTSFQTLVTTHGAASEWQVDSEEYTEAQASRSGVFVDETSLAFFGIYIEAQVPAAGTGSIHQVSIRETPITAASSLPRGAS